MQLLVGSEYVVAQFEEKSRELGSWGRSLDGVKLKLKWDLRTGMCWNWVSVIAVLIPLLVVTNELWLNWNFRNPNESGVHLQLFLSFRLVYRCQSSNGSTYTEESMIPTSDQRLERLRKWLRTLNHDDCNLKLERCAQGSSGSGYGAFAGPGGVAKGSVIVKVPREALMTEEVIELATYLLTQLLLNSSDLRCYLTSFGLDCRQPDNVKTSDLWWRRVI